MSRQTSNHDFPEVGEDEEELDLGNTLDDDLDDEDDPFFDPGDYEDDEPEYDDDSYDEYPDEAWFDPWDEY